MFDAVGTRVPHGYTVTKPGRCASVTVTLSTTAVASAGTDARSAICTGVIEPQSAGSFALLKTVDRRVPVTGVEHPSRVDRLQGRRGGEVAVDIDDELSVVRHEQADLAVDTDLGDHRVRNDGACDEVDVGCSGLRGSARDTR